jgi:hypothetical protein
MFGQKPLICLKRKRSKEFTLDPRIMTDIEVFPTDQAFTRWTRMAPMIKDIFDLIPRTTVKLNFDGLSRKRFRWRTDIGCTKSVWSQINQINCGIQE